MRLKRMNPLKLISAKMEEQARKEEERQNGEAEPEENPEEEEIDICISCKIRES